MKKAVAGDWMDRLEECIDVLPHGNLVALEHTARCQRCLRCIKIVNPLVYWTRGVRCSEFRILCHCCDGRLNPTCRDEGFICSATFHLSLYILLDTILPY